jgi:hypothetical protein
MTNVDGTITPVGLEFDRMRPNTTLQITQPTAIDGFGTVHPGEMTYKGPVKSPARRETIGGRFTFAGNKIDFNPAVGHELGMANPATLRQATFVLQAGVLRLNSVLVEKGSRAVYASHDQQPLEVGGHRQPPSNHASPGRSPIPPGGRRRPRYHHRRYGHPLHRW